MKKFWKLFIVVKSRSRLVLESPFAHLDISDAKDEALVNLFMRTSDSVTLPNPCIVGWLSL